MAIRFVCACGRRRLFPDTSLGQTATCRKCGASFAIAGEKVVAPRVSPIRRLLPLILVLAIPSVVGVVVYRSRQPRFTSAMEEYRDGSKALVDPKIDGPRIERLFASLAAASRDGNESSFGSCFHGRRMLAEIELRGGIDAVGMRRDELSLEDEVYATVRDWCDQLKNKDSAWQSVHRCSYRFLEGRGEAEAAVVMRAKDHLSRFRFWVIKENDTWTIFDYESLENSFRMSTHNGKLLVRQAKGQLSGHRMEKASGLIDKAENLLVREKPDEALVVLQEAEVSAPGPLQPFVELVQAEALFRLGREKEALEKVDLALQHQKDLPQAIQFRGIIRCALQRYDDCIRDQQDYMKAVGEDAAAWFWIGRSYEGLGKRDEAVKAYRRGADCDETETVNRSRLKALGKSDD
jgi:tetratricopeptide (TPR) repeat protein